MAVSTLNLLCHEGCDGLFHPKTETILSKLTLVVRPLKIGAVDEVLILLCKERCQTTKIVNPSWIFLMQLLTNALENKLSNRREQT